MRAKQGYSDPTPTLVDIERTHILFVNAHFKPFAAIGYEYNRVRPNSGQPSFGQSIQFSIPQFGDFFHDMVVHAVLEEVSCNTATAGQIPVFPTVLTNSTVVTTGTSAINSDPDTVNDIFTRYTYEYVDLQGRVVNRATNVYADDGSAYTARNFVRYAEYPGQRLLSVVKFEVNGNPLDEYNSAIQAFHQKFRVAPGKLTGWKRLVGQEVPIDAESDLCTIAGTSPWMAPTVGLTLTAGGAAPVAPVNATLTTRRLSSILNGPQTPKVTQPQLDMWIPLLLLTWQQFMQKHGLVNIIYL